LRQLRRYGQRGQQDGGGEQFQFGHREILQMS
jgi:hypothetical protein